MLASLVSTCLLHLPVLAHAAEPEAFPNMGPMPDARWVEGDDGPPQKPPKPVRVETRWYGWQTLAVDAVGVAVLSTTWDRGRGDEGGAVALYALGAPAVHAFHGQGKRTITGVGLRLASTFLGLVAGLGCWESKEPHCVRKSTAVALSIYPIVDAAFAWEEVPVYAKRADPRRFAWTPMVTPLAGRGGLVGISGAF